MELAEEGVAESAKVDELIHKHLKSLSLPK
jgi:hypothetical protein